MKRLAVYVQRALLVLAIIVIGVFIGSAIYIRSSAFGIFLKTHIQSSLANTFRGEATLGTVDTSAPGTIAITDFRIRFDGKEIVRIPELRAEYSLVPLLWHQVRIKVSAYRPRFDFARDRNGEWNLLQALALKSSRSFSATAS